MSMLATSAASGARPRTLGEQVASRRPPQVLSQPGLTAVPGYWQVPAATEQAGFEAVLQAGMPEDAEYFGFPWATLIDGLRGGAAMIPALLTALRVATGRPRTRARRVTVAQHIHALQFPEFLVAAGITDVFWSHATHSGTAPGGLRIHAFPLFPAQTPEGTYQRDASRPRRHLANFIGAYNPKVYLTGVRAAIFDDIGVEPDLLVIRREQWHFDRAVYEEQVRGVAPDEQRRLVEAQHAREYLDAIMDSWFTLCPSGSGPNSIRIFESLCLGSIPIVLTRDLRLAGPEDLWRAAALIEDDSVDGYRRAKAAARAMPPAQREQMLQAGRELLPHVAPSAYARLIHQTLRATGSAPVGA